MWGYYNLGSALEAQGKLDEAITVYREAIRQKPDDAAGHISLGAILCDKKHEYLAATAQFREAIRLQPDSALAHLNLGVALRRQGKLDEAVAEQREAIRLEPNDAYNHFSLARTLEAGGRSDDVIVEYREMVRLQPGNGVYRNDLAWSLVLAPERPRRLYEEALMHARKGVELAPENRIIFLSTLALAEYRVGHWAESIAASERSMALQNGGAAWDWFFLAMAHAQMAEKDEARKWFDKAVVWTKEKDSRNSELRQFWTEAAELLGQPGPDAPRPGSPPTPAVEKPR
jgi:tetratricopeptide (TPR) repeat protein